MAAVGTRGSVVTLANERPPRRASALRASAVWTAALNDSDENDEEDEVDEEKEQEKEQELKETGEQRIQLDAGAATSETSNSASSAVVQRAAPIEPASTNEEEVVEEEESDDVGSDDDYLPPASPGSAKRARAASALFPSPGAYLPPQRTPPSPLWALPDEVWLRILQLGYCSLPMGRMRSVCRRFYALAAELTRRSVPRRRQKWCYHCLSTDVVQDRYCYHLRFPLCLTCQELPMHRIMCESRMCKFFYLTRADLLDSDVQYRLRNPHDRHFSRMKMYTNETAEVIATIKWGEAFVKARRDFDELGLNPTLPAPTAVERKLASDRVLRALARSKVLRAEERHKEAVEHERQRRRWRRQIRKAFKAHELPWEQFAKYPQVIAHCRTGVPALGDVVAFCERSRALQDAFKAASLPDLDIAVLHGEQTTFRVNNPHELYLDVVTKFLATGIVEPGVAMTAANVAQLAADRRRRRYEVDNLLANVYILGYFTRMLTAIRTGYIMNNCRDKDTVLALAEQTRDEMTTLYDSYERQGLAKRAQNKREREEFNKVMRTEHERQLVVRADANEPMRWAVTLALDGSAPVVPATQDAWLAPFRVDGQPEGTPLTNEGRFGALANFGRASNLRELSRADIPREFWPLLRPIRALWADRPLPAVAAPVTGASS